MQRISRDFDAYVAKNVTMEWDKQKEKIFEHFGLLPMTEGEPDRFGASTFGASTFGHSARSGAGGVQGSVYASTSVWARSAAHSILARPAPAPSGSIFADVDPSKQLTMSRPVQIRQQNYAGIIRQLNEGRLTGSPYPILHKCEEVSQGSGSDVVSCHYILTEEAIPLISLVDATTHRFLEDVGAHNPGRSRGEPLR